MKYEQVEGGSAAVFALKGETKILLGRNPRRRDPKWKLFAETMKPGESILNTLLAGLTEEAGMTDIKTEMGENGKVARFIDPRIKGVVEFGEREWIASTRIPHWRHFFGVITTDEVINRLSGETHIIEEEDEVEEIQTMEFPLAMLETLGDSLLRPHAELIRSIPQRKVKEVG